MCSGSQQSGSGGSSATACPNGNSDCTVSGEICNTLMHNYCMPSCANDGQCNTNGQIDMLCDTGLSMCKRKPCPNGNECTSPNICRTDRNSPECDAKCGDQGGDSVCGGGTCDRCAQLPQ